MTTKNKLLTLLLVSSGAAASIATINKFIQVSAVSKHTLYSSKSEPLCYHWHLGNIHYTKTGQGNPILLLHDLTPSSSGYEWHKMVSELSKNRCVYVLDLLGCGRSEKPNMTYTNYLYVQLISDFIKNTIGHRTDVIATGSSSPLVTMACSANPDLFNRLIFINPDSLLSCSQVPRKHSKLFKFILDLPLVGTLLYYIATSRQSIKEMLSQKCYCNPYSMSALDEDAYYEAAHLGESPKSIFGSISCNYVKCNIVNALKKIDNSIYLIGGEEFPHITEIMEEYKLYNPAIESAILPKTKQLPQLENPKELCKLIDTFFCTLTDTEEDSPSVN
ncbi:MAG: alpha/beta hydrolase [bacterium]|nr:alpha/beta hydrolase [bacterium]